MTLPISKFVPQPTRTETGRAKAPARGLAARIGALWAAVALAAPSLASAAGGLPSVTRIEADSRGRVVLTMSHDLNTSTLPGSSRVTVAGLDGLFGTTDDAEASSSVSYVAASRQLVIEAFLTPDQRYRVQLNASMVRDTLGRLLDGEFQGASTISGDGVEGGDLVFFTREMAEPIARFVTVNGTIDVRLFPDETPITVANFRRYAGRGVYDSTFFHRSVANFVVQAGGFTSVEGFPSIAADPAIMNEPGIENIRGTIAMAKLGNNPNSATNQWFFNLGDNRANLDNQNGGFTVFGEIVDDAGLDVMDVIGALSRFNASSQNSAFNEVPVQNLAAVTPRGRIIPSDLVSFTRVSIMVDVVGQPALQLPEAGSVRLVHPDGTATVQVFDLDGTGGLGNAAFLKVTFGRNNTISNIQFKDPMPTGRVGVFISNAASVGTITDLRRTTTGDVAFIVSDAAVGSISLTKPLSGYDLNGYVLPTSRVLPSDIDGDGERDDLLALLLETGFVNSLTMSGGVTGDMVLRGGLRTGRFGGTVERADLDLGTTAASVSGVDLTFAAVRDSDVRTADRITSLRAMDWTDDDIDRENLIRAASIGTLSITGDRTRGLRGDFNNGLTLTQSGGTAASLGSVNIAGEVVSADWQVAGSVGPITIRQNVMSWSLGGATSVGPVQVMGFVNDGRLTASGAVSRISVPTWENGSIRAASLATLDVRGDARQSLVGNFSPTLTLTGGGTQQVLRSANIAGNLLSPTIAITGNIGTFTVRGSVDRTNFTITNGTAQTMTLGAMTQGTFNLGGGVTRFTAASVDGTTLSGSFYDAFTVNGSFRGAFNASVFGTAMFSRDFSGSVSSRGGNMFRVGGNVQDSSITFTEPVQSGQENVGMLTVAWSLANSEIRSIGSLDRVRIGSMIDSGLYVGLAAPATGLPTSSSGVTNAEILDLQVGSSTTDGRGFANSFIVAGSIRLGRLSQIVSNNSGRAFGVATDSVRSFNARSDAGQFSLGPTSASPSAINDFQVLLNFTGPAQ